MNKFVTSIALGLALAASACSNSKNENAVSESQDPVAGTNPKVLVAYFSATGTTEKAAKEVADATGGTLFRIEPAQPYTDADLDYENKNSRTTQEKNDPSIRPEIKKSDLDIAPYDTIYLGYPIWWYKAPVIINTFLDSYDFEGKHIVLFSTAASSSIAGTVKALKEDYPQYDFTEGGNLTSATKSEWNKWVQSLGK